MVNAFQGLCVSSCNALISCCSVWCVGWAKEAFQVSMGNASWLYSASDVVRPTCCDRMRDTVLWNLLIGLSNWCLCAVGPISIPR